MVNKEVFEKVKKLLALAGNNPSQNEAHAAMLKAQKLMAKYNLDMKVFEEAGEAPQKEVKESWVKGGQSCQWMRKLAKVIADNFRCELMIGTGYGLVFVGLTEDTEICTQVFNFASHTLDRNMAKLRRQYRKQGLSTEGISGDYSEGFIKGLRDKFKEQVTQNDWGLILVKDQAVIERVNKIKNPHKSAGQGKALPKSGNPGLYAKGYMDGNTLTDPSKTLNS